MQLEMHALFWNVPFHSHFIISFTLSSFNSIIEVEISYCHKTMNVMCSGMAMSVAVCSAVKSNICEQDGDL